MQGIEKCKDPSLPSINKDLEINAKAIKAYYNNCFCREKHRVYNRHIRVFNLDFERAMV